MQKSHEKGVVLVSVLIIVAMISLVVSLMWQQQAHSLTNTKNSIHTNQAISYLYSMESWVQSILKQDDDKVDDLTEDWASKIPPIPVPNGTIQGEIFDLQARLNINHLIDIKKDENQAYIKAKNSHFLNTLNSLLEQDFMSDLILEHINAHLPPQKFEHISQLKLVEGLSLEDYLNIKPYLYASKTEKITININTASKEIIAALHPDLSLSSAETIIDERPFALLDDAYQAIAQVLNESALRQIKEIEIIDIKSHYFLLKSDININDIYFQAQTLFHRQEKSLSIIERTYQQILEE